MSDAKKQVAVHMRGRNKGKAACGVETANTGYRNSTPTCGRCRNHPIYKGRVQRRQARRKLYRKIIKSIRRLG